MNFRNFPEFSGFPVFRTHALLGRSSGEEEEDINKSGSVIYTVLVVQQEIALQNYTKHVARTAVVNNIT